MFGLYQNVSFLVGQGEYNKKGQDANYDLLQVELRYPSLSKMRYALASAHGLVQRPQR